MFLWQIYCVFWHVSVSLFLCRNYTLCPKSLVELQPNTLLTQTPSFFRRTLQSPIFQWVLSAVPMPSQLDLKYFFFRVCANFFLPFWTSSVSKWLFIHCSLHSFWQCLMPETFQLQIEDMSEAALVERIQLRKVKAAVDMFDQLMQSGKGGWAYANSKHRFGFFFISLIISLTALFQLTAWGHNFLHLWIGNFAVVSS